MKFEWLFLFIVVLNTTSCEIREFENLFPEAKLTALVKDITPPNYSIILDGSESKDYDGAITFLWEQIEDTPDGVIIATPSSHTTEVILTEAGTYTFKLTVTDDEGISAFDSVHFTIIDMVFVEGGAFQMGDSIYRKELTKDSCDIERDEKHVHTVTLDDFYIGKYEVTLTEWIQVMGTEPDNPKFLRCDNCPIYGLNWYDAISFCNKLSEMHGLNNYYDIITTEKDLNNKGNLDTIKWLVEINEGANGYRLPTEAEWEYAARGGVKRMNTIFAGSDNADEVAWYRVEALKPVGEKKANELGLHDMSGNIAEWCYDWWEKNYYSTSENINPLGPVQGSHRVIRGGAWLTSSSADTCRMGPEVDLRNLTVFTRFHTTPNHNAFTLGFRIAKNAIN